ncbi:MAG: type V CRISPR-associated endonuclease Cas1 [Leptospiraceae bacterium]|nr:type V CRISPR-associated endonuclease Cas1 [Leptospiraceae bacterium]
MLSLPDFKEKTIVIFHPMEGQAISFKNDNMIINDSEDKIILQVTCYKLFSLWVVGGTTLTTGILEKSKKFAFSIYFLSYYQRPIGLWGSSLEGNFLLRKKQYKYEEVGIARYLIENKISNQLLLLKSIRSKSDEVKESIKKIESYRQELENANEFTSILGLEGISSKVFFSRWFSELDWKGRRPRIKLDITNCILDIGYTYLFNFVESLVSLYGFDIYQGVYHKNFYQRKSLVCDLVEPFRCIIDKKIKTAYGLNQIKEDDFGKKQNQYYLKIDKNKYYSKWILEAILERKEEMFLFMQEYYRCFMKNKPISEYPRFTITGE